MSSLPEKPLSVLAANFLTADEDHLRAYARKMLTTGFQPYQLSARNDVMVHPQAAVASRLALIYDTEPHSYWQDRPQRLAQMRALESLLQQAIGHSPPHMDVSVRQVGYADSHLLTLVVKSDLFADVEALKESLEQSKTTMLEKLATTSVPSVLQAAGMIV